MTKQAIVAAAMAATMGLSGVAVTDVARADGIFNGMNPFNWVFGRDRDDYYYRDRWERQGQRRPCAMANTSRRWATGTRGGSRSAD